LLATALEPAPVQDQPEQRRLILALGVAVFMINLDARVVAPLLPTLASELGVSLASAAWLLSAYMLPYGLCQLLFGPLADRYGKVTVCSHAMAAFSVGTACTALWPSFAAIVTLRALTGACAAGLIPLTLAYIGDTVPYERRQATIATLMASAGAAQALSTSLGGTLATVLSWREVFPVLGALAGVSALALYFFGRQARQAPVFVAERPRYLSVLTAPRMWPLLLLVGSEGFLFMGGLSYLSGLLEERFGLGVLHIGWVMAGTGAAQLLTARLMPRLIPQLPERRRLAIGGVALALAYLACAAAPHWSVVAAGCALIGVGFILCHTTLQTRATEAVPQARGTAVALFAFSLFLGSGVGTALLGLVLEASSFGVLFLCVGLALGIFTLITVRVLGRPLAS
jgi:predicted MFS family arabinose efflux permease